MQTYDASSKTRPPEPEAIPCFSADNF